MNSFKIISHQERNDTKFTRALVLENKIKEWSIASTPWNTHLHIVSELEMDIKVPFVKMIWWTHRVAPRNWLSKFFYSKEQIALLIKEQEKEAFKEALNKVSFIKEKAENKNITLKEELQYIINNGIVTQKKSIMSPNWYEEISLEDINLLIKFL